MNPPAICNAFSLLPFLLLLLATLSDAFTFLRIFCIPPSRTTRLVSAAALSPQASRPAAFPLHASREPGYIHLGHDCESMVHDTISLTDDYDEISQCAQFFVESFWLKSTSFGSLDLSQEQRKELDEEQIRDMTTRYGRLVGRRKLQSALLVARSDSGEIEGCVGLEVAVADAETGNVLPRSAHAGVRAVLSVGRLGERGVRVGAPSWG